jgi:hypothetical protein
MGRREDIAKRVQRDIALQEAKRERDAIIDSPINGFDVAREVDRENLRGAVEFFDVLSQGAGTIKWTMTDNTEKQVTKQELMDAIATYVARKGLAFAQYQQFKEGLK